MKCYMLRCKEPATWRVWQESKHETHHPVKCYYCDTHVQMIAVKSIRNGLRDQVKGERLT